MSRCQQAARSQPEFPLGDASPAQPGQAHVWMTCGGRHSCHAGRYRGSGVWDRAGSPLSSARRSNALLSPILSAHALRRGTFCSGHPASQQHAPQSLAAACAETGCPSPTQGGEVQPRRSLRSWSRAGAHRRGEGQGRLSLDTPHPPRQCLVSARVQVAPHLWETFAGPKATACSREGTSRPSGRQRRSLSGRWGEHPVKQIGNNRDTRCHEAAGPFPPLVEGPLSLSEEQSRAPRTSPPLTSLGSCILSKIFHPARTHPVFLGNPRLSSRERGAPNPTGLQKQGPCYSSPLVLYSAF